MSQAIGSLYIALGLDTAALSDGVKQAQSRIAKFSSDLSNKLGKLGDVPGIKSLQASLISVSRNAAAAAGAMTAALATGAAAMSVSAMNSAKEISNLSALANATPEEFQRWGYAAEQVGISQEKMGDILKDVNDRVGDFIATGGGPMADFFERIGPKVGVTAEHFRNLSGPQALQLYVSSLEKANVNQQDFTFFMEAMASDSTALVPLLKNGGAAAKAYGDRLEALGGVMGNETVARLARMRRAMSEIAVVMTGVKNAIGAAFAPVVSALAGAFVSLMTKGSALRMIFDGITKVAGVVANAFSAVVNVISHVTAAIWSGISAAASWINQFTGIGTVIQTIWDYTGGAVLKLISGISDVLDATGGLGGAFTLLGEVASGVWQGIVTMAGAIPAGLEAVWESVKAGFSRMVASLSETFSQFVQKLGAWASVLPGGEALSSALFSHMAKLDAQTQSFNRSAIEAGVRAAALREETSALASAGFLTATDALGRLKIQVEETGTTLAGGGGSLGAGLDAVGKKGGAAKEKLSSLQKVMKALSDEAQKLRATMGMSDLDTSIWEKQREAGVTAASANGKIISAQMKQINAMKELKTATDEWKQSISGALSEFITKGGSFKNVLSQIISKLAEMVFNKGFEALWGGSGMGGIASGVLGFFGIGANANGTNNWGGGLTRINERGGEIMNLPRGTQIIPNDISKRMADTASKGGGGSAMHITVGFDERSQLHVREVAQREVASGISGYDRRLTGRVKEIDAQSKWRR